MLHSIIVTMATTFEPSFSLVQKRVAMVMYSLIINHPDSTIINYDIYNLLRQIIDIIIMVLSRGWYT